MYFAKGWLRERYPCPFKSTATSRCFSTRTVQAARPAVSLHITNVFPKHWRPHRHGRAQAVSRGSKETGRRASTGAAAVQVAPGRAAPTAPGLLPATGGHRSPAGCRNTRCTGRVPPPAARTGGRSPHRGGCALPRPAPWPVSRPRAADPGGEPQSRVPRRCVPCPLSRIP